MNSKKLLHPICAIQSKTKSRTISFGAAVKEMFFFLFFFSLWFSSAGNGLPPHFLPCSVNEGGMQHKKNRLGIKGRVIFNFSGWFANRLALNDWLLFDFSSRIAAVLKNLWFETQKSNQIFKSEATYSDLACETSSIIYSV